MKLTLLLSLTLFLTCNGIGQIKRISVLPSDCKNCGMTALGQVNMKICGGIPDQCCSVVNIANFQSLHEVTTNHQPQSFKLLSTIQGEVYHFSGEHELEDCFNYFMQRVNTLDEFGLTLYHEGSDGGQFDWVEVETSDNTIIRCILGTQISIA